MSNLINVGTTLPAGPAYPQLFNFINPVSSLPQSGSLRAALLFGGNEAVSLNNKVSGGTDATKVGSPTLGTIGYAVNPTACLDSGQSEASAMTVIVMFKPIASYSAGAMMYSDYSSSTPNGVSLYQNGANTIQGLVPTSSSFATTSVTPTLGTTDWQLACLRCDTTNMAVAHRHNGTLTASSDIATGSRGVLSKTMRIGGHYSVGFTDTITIGAVFDWNVKLNDSDRATAMSTIASIMNDYAGITTL